MIPPSQLSMDPTTTNTTERLDFDGPIGLSLSVVLGLLLVALFAWALWREQHVLGRRNLLLFGVLRVVALATVIWLLLAPARVRIDSSTTRRAVVLMTDVSGSMQTVDPAGSADDLRWAISGTAPQRSTSVEAADRANAAVGMARQQLLRATEALNRHEAESIVVDAVGSADEAIERAREHLQNLLETSGSRAVSVESKSLLLRLISRIDAPEFAALDQLSTALKRGRTPSQKGWRESLPDIESQLAGIEQTLRELSRHIVAEETDRIARDKPELLTSIQNASRVARAGSFLDRLEQTTLTAVRAEADVRSSSFDLAVRAYSDPASPRESLAPWTRPDESGLELAATDLSAAMDQIHREHQEQPLAAVFLVTDVHHNESSELNPRDAAAALDGTPVYIVPIGNTEHVRDVVLQSVSAPAVAMRNDDIVIEVALQAHDCAGEACLVQLLQDGEVVDFREVLLDTAFASRAVRFEQQMPTIGEQQFQVAITPLEGEASEDNNYDEFEVNVTRSDIKVLLADEWPRWEYRYLAQLFRRDPKVECDELLYHPRMIATGRREETKTLPITADDWDQYDVVLLGDLPPDHFPAAAQDALSEYLQKRGGTLVLIAGRESMPQAYVNHPLEELLPVLPIEDANHRTPGYSFQVTDEGSDHEALMIAETDEETRLAWEFVNRFSPINHVSEWRRPRPSAHTLIAAVPRNSLNSDADARNSAFLCWQPLGRGRVVYLSGPDTYRLRLLRGDQLHYRFWGQLLRWVIASDLSAGTEFVRIRTDRSRYDTHDDVQATVRLTNEEGEPVVAEGISVRLVSSDDERTVPLTGVSEVPGEYTATIRSLPPGVYRIEAVGDVVDSLQQEGLEAASASFTVQAELPLELVDVRSDRALARQIAGVTGGQVLPPTAVDEILRLTDLSPIVSQSVERRPLWLEWKYLWLIFGCLQLEWIVRKWKGLS